MPLPREVWAQLFTGTVLPAPTSGPDPRSAPAQFDPSPANSTIHAPHQIDAAAPHDAPPPHLTAAAPPPPARADVPSSETLDSSPAFPIKALQHASRHPFLHHRVRARAAPVPLLLGVIPHNRLFAARHTRKQNHSHSTVIRSLVSERTPTFALTIPRA